MNRAPSEGGDGARRPLWARLRRSQLALGVFRGLAVGFLILAAFHWIELGGTTPVQPLPSIPSAAIPAVPSSQADRRQVDFAEATPSTDVRVLAHWLVRSGDAGGMPFFIIDKSEAQLYVFGADAQLRATTPVLLGGARGDDTVAGIGARPIADVRPEERTTPAGRFVSERGRNLRGEEVVWVDYDAAVSMHRVVTSNLAERRLERLATATPDDNRISYGCINVPAAFFDVHVLPVVARARAIVYILPETRALSEVFAMGEGAESATMDRPSTQARTPWGWPAALPDPFTWVWTAHPQQRRS